MVRDTHGKRTGIQKKILVWCGVLICMLVIIAYGVYQTATFYPFRNAIVLGTDPVIVLSLDADAKQVTVITIPSDTIVDGVYSSGEYAISSLYRLGRLPSSPKNLFVLSIEELLHTPVRRIFAPKSDTLWSISNVKEFIREQFQIVHSVDVLTRSHDTNLTFTEFLAVSKLLSAIPDAAWKILPLSEVSTTVEVTRPDGSLVEKIDPERLSYHTSSVFLDDAIRRESMSVEIYNATGISGLGARFAYILNQSGMRILTVGNTNRRVTGCEIVVGRAPNTQKTIKWFKNFFSCVISGSEFRDLKADVGIFIGSDYAKRFMVP